MSNEKKKGRKISLTRSCVYDVEAKLSNVLALLAQGKEDGSLTFGQLNAAHQQVAQICRILHNDIRMNDEDVFPLR